MATKDSTISIDEINNDSPDGMSSDKLQFQDIPHGELSSQSTTPQGGRTPTQHYPDVELSDDEEDKTNLLKSESTSSPSFWTFEYYQQFFDVETKQVMGRILGSMLPNPKSNYLQQHLRPKPDLYGPFWVCTTLVFTTAIAGNMANYFQHAGQDYEWRYDFHKVTFAAAAIFSYWWLVPTILFGLLHWRGNPAGFGFLEMICLYGYSLAIYIPISILWVIQLNWLQWLLVIVGMLLSGGVLVMTFWPAVREDDKKIVVLTLGLIFLFHGLLAIGFVLYFFHVPDVSLAHNTTMPTLSTPLTTTAHKLS